MSPTLMTQLVGLIILLHLHYMPVGAATRATLSYTLTRFYFCNDEEPDIFGSNEPFVV